MTLLLILIAVVGFSLYLWNASNVDQILSFWVDKDKDKKE